MPMRGECGYKRGAKENGSRREHVGQVCFPPKPIGLLRLSQDWNAGTSSCKVESSPQ